MSFSTVAYYVFLYDTATMSFSTGSLLPVVLRSSEIGKMEGQNAFSIFYIGCKNERGQVIGV